MKYGVIYMHRNKINNKVYIGQTTQKPEYRWNHGFGYKDSSLFFASIQKYGWDNFEHIILEKDIPENKLDERESFWINFFNSNNRLKGYNLTSGGTGKLNKQQKIEKKKKILEWRMAHPEIANKSIKGMQQYWQLHPEEKRQILIKASEKAKEYWQSHPEEKKRNMKKMQDKAKEKNTKKILCIETNVSYESAREAFRQTGIHYASIGKVCNGKAKTAGGFHWIFIKGEDKND